MGIPLYFKTLSSNYPETIINDLSSILHNPIKQNYLFFDLNCAIHPCCRNIMKEYNSTNVGKDKLEKRMFTEIIEFIKSILELVQPTLVFIAIDGVAPFAKMVQQMILVKENTKYLNIFVITVYQIRKMIPIHNLTLLYMV